MTSVAVICGKRGGRWDVFWNTFPAHVLRGLTLAGLEGPYHATAERLAGAVEADVVLSFWV